MAAAAELDEKQRLVFLAGMNSSSTSPLINTTPQTKPTEHYEVLELLDLLRTLCAGLKWHATAHRTYIQIVLASVFSIHRKCYAAAWLLHSSIETGAAAAVCSIFPIEFLRGLRRSAPLRRCSLLPLISYASKFNQESGILVGTDSCWTLRP